MSVCPLHVLEVEAALPIIQMFSVLLGIFAVFVDQLRDFAKWICA